MGAAVCTRRPVIVSRLPHSLADQRLPPQVAVIALTRSGRGRGDRGDHDDARLPLPHQPQLLPRDGLDVLVGVQVLAKRLQALVALLEIGYLSLQPVLTLAELPRLESGGGSRNEEVAGDDRRQRQHDARARDFGKTLRHLPPYLPPILPPFLRSSNRYNVRPPI